ITGKRQQSLGSCPRETCDSLPQPYTIRPPGGPMKLKSVSVMLSWFSATAFIFGQAPAQVTTPAAQGRGAAATPQQCRPSAQPAPPPGGAAATGRGGGAGRGAGAAVPGQATPRGDVTAIPGIVEAGAKWTKIWQSGGNSADGIISDRDGSVLVAQEDFDAVLK